MTNTRDSASANNSLLKLSILLPVIILLMFGSIDLGRFIFTMIVIANASREGARYLSAHPIDNHKMICDDGRTEPGGYCNNKDTVVRRAQNFSVKIRPGNVSILPPCTDINDAAGCDRGYPVNVGVTVKMDLFLSWFLSDPVTLFRETQLMVP